MATAGLCACLSRLARRPTDGKELSDHEEIVALPVGECGPADDGSSSSKALGLRASATPSLEERIAYLEGLLLKSATPATGSKDRAVAATTATSGNGTAHETRTIDDLTSDSEASIDEIVSEAQVRNFQDDEIMSRIGTGQKDAARGRNLTLESVESLQAVQPGQIHDQDTVAEGPKPGVESGFLRSISRQRELQDDVGHLRATLTEQAATIEQLRQTLSSVQKDIGRSVSVLQYNILAAYLGDNTAPWFLYGADISAEDREKIFKRYYQGEKWPAYADQQFSDEDMRRVEEQNKAYFAWQQRKLRLVEEVKRRDADVVSLVELDKYDFFVEHLHDVWDSAFHKRPRPSSLDGCGLFWRRSKFELVAKHTMDFVDGSDHTGAQKRDRCCLMVLLRWRSEPSKYLVAISTHLARNPENRAQTRIRVRQVSQLLEGLTDFTKLHGVQDMPVVLLGDLNAQHFGEIRGIARTVWQIRGKPIHKFLWNATDVQTGPTSVTNARLCRIDCVQFQSTMMEVLEVAQIPRVAKGQVIPNAEHPSDHFPVFARLRVKETFQRHQECARSWLECVAGHERVHPLGEEELRTAFEFFDRCCTNSIGRRDLEEACIDLQCALNRDIQSLLLDCFPKNKIYYKQFVAAYEARLNHERVRYIGDLESAFAFFAAEGPDPTDQCRALGSDAGGQMVLSAKLLEAAFRDITPVSFSDEEIQEMICRLGIHSHDQCVDLRSFCEVACRATFPARQREADRGEKCFERATSKSSQACSTEFFGKLARFGNFLDRSLSQNAVAARKT
eukprot:TRINITY_DN121749_c0_g1_i1.p1 TRINITY_DN121749_c0_g1~~TRINITY_DN121749_c0_g1_i1.p1  ORF type:complete len:789 (-),score=191.34 TRINITY_DN121749_c0_g1_i1:148-2514(-)